MHSSRRRLTLTYGRGAVLNPDGSVDRWVDLEPVPNFLADEGEQLVLDVFFREQANVSKYLALLTGASPAETATMAGLSEVFAPPANGYARQQVAAGDWGAAVLDAGDFKTTAATKTFGPASGSAWNSLTYIVMVTTATGTAGKFISALALSATTTVAVGQSFLYTLSQRAQ